jgi:hypothetical protein
MPERQHNKQQRDEHFDGMLRQCYQPQPSLGS